MKILLILIFIAETGQAQSTLAMFDDLAKCEEAKAAVRKQVTSLPAGVGYALTCARVVVPEPPKQPSPKAPSVSALR